MAEANQLQRIPSFQYPAAHIGHLDQKQTTALNDFKELCKTKGYFAPATDDAAASHDDETLLRYLRARKFVPQDAFTQFKDTEDWRKKQKIEELYDTIDVQEYDETRRLYPQWTGRRDKRGIPVYVFQVADLNSKRMSAYEASAGKAKEPGRLPPKLLRLFALYENLTRFVMPLCSAVISRPHPETPISQSNNIVDISDVGLRQFWNLKGHMQDASTLATAHYPETLDRIFIIGAPSFFPTVWSWIKRWFDPITVSKIFILGPNDVKPTLLKFLEEENIPKAYGGSLEWEWGSLPALEPAIENALKWPEGQEHKFPTGPIKWRTTQDGKQLEAVAVGTQAGKPREQIIATVAHSDVSPQAVELAGATVTNKPELAAAADSDLQNSSSETRDGTSASKYAGQSHTLADGQLADSTPDTREHGHGDTTSTMEPSTVGQAPKDVSVPSATSDGEAAGDATILGKAQAALGSVAGVATGAGQSVLAVVGLSSKPADTSDNAAESAAKDERVDGMPRQQVENFLRSQVETGARKGEDDVEKPVAS